MLKVQLLCSRGLRACLTPSICNGICRILTDIAQEIEGFTWPGIEYGAPPSCKYSFYEYVDALRLGDVARFKAIEAESRDWWFASLDRGAGAALHFAADHGQLEAARFLVEQRAAPVNQQDVQWGWTPLHRAARIAHYCHAHGLALFEYLLQQGADAGIRSFDGVPSPITNEPSKAACALDVAVEKGYGWEPGQVRQVLQGLVDKYSHVPKATPFVYKGPIIGPVATAVLKAWQDSEQAQACVAPEDWRPPPPAGFLDAAGMGRVEEEPWRPAGDDDGSVFMRQMTDAELSAQATLVAAL